MLARNRNILSFGLVAALVSGFSSCTEVPVDTQQLVNHQVHDEYVANFVAKYGQPSPNQSWDFSGRDMNNADEDILPCIEPETRAISSAAVVLNEWEDPSDERMVIGYLPAVSTYNEFAWIRDNVASGELKECCIWLFSLICSSFFCPFYIKKKPSAMHITCYLRANIGWHIWYIMGLW